MRPGHKEVGRENLGEDRASDGQRRQTGPRGVAARVATTCTPGPSGRRAAASLAATGLRSDRGRVRLSAPDTAARSPSADAPNGPALSATRSAADPPSSTWCGASPRDRVPRAPTLRGRVARWRQSCPGVTRSARNAARHGALVPLRQLTRRQARADCAATRAATVIVCSPGASTRRVRGRPLPISGAGGLAGVECRERPSGRTTPRAHTAASRDARCGATSRCRRTRHRRRPPSAETRCHAPVAAASRRAAISLGSDTACGIRARCRASAVSHVSGRYNAAPSIHARAPVHNATVTATWQLAILPKLPQYLSRDAHRVRPLLGKARAVENQHAFAFGNHRRTWRQTRSALHGACVMKCWND